jgi:murein DD-endopeptidase MepM/ murein hydrolase activator NlpD
MKGANLGRAVSRLGVSVLVLIATATIVDPISAAAQVSPSPSDGSSPSASVEPGPSSSAPPPSSSPTDMTPSVPAPTTSPTGPTTTPSPTFLPFPSGNGGKIGLAQTHHRPLGIRKRLKDAEDRGHRRHRSWKGWAPDPRWGDYGTVMLDRAAAIARHRGWSDARIAKKIYAPFIVEGPATWSDSWGAPRWTGGYHPHHGQDVLCRFGAPVIAVERGTVVFGSDRLGGRTLSLVLPDGSSWYYAHLRSYVPGLSPGDSVRAGRVIAQCGASGDASVPHVHFAFFTSKGVARDPMRSLVSWLQRAQHRVRTLFGRPAAPQVRIHPRQHVRPIRPASAETDLIDVGEAALAVRSQDAWSPRRRAVGVASVWMLVGVGWLAVVRRRSRSA